MKVTSIWILGFLAAAAQQAAADDDCAGLMRSKFPDTEITRAESIAAGAHTLPGPSIKPADTLRRLQAFCRVTGIIRPTADSQIGFELWLPAQWNGRYLQVGNGGFAGTIFSGGLVQGLQNGFAVAGTDDGHVGPDTGWMMGHPEKVTDFGHRAVHLTSVTAKQIVSAHYGRPIPHAYFSGCSDGGRESLMEAQRYPDDFDGWIVGAPANDWIGVMAFLLNQVQTTVSQKEPLTAAHLQALSAAAVARCDEKDGIRDGVIDHPLQCAFDPAELQCNGVRKGQCLSKEQVAWVKRTYADVKAAATDASLVPGLQGTRGAEADTWVFSKLGDAAAAAAMSFYDQVVRGFWPRMVYADPALDYRKLDLLQAIKDGRSHVGPVLSSVDPNLGVIRASGKKIIQYHGWADAAIPAQYSTGYYEAVEKYLGRDNRDFYRLFMAPGVGHCWAGPGPNVFGGAYVPGGRFDADHHMLAALMQWVEHGKAPERIIATKYQDDDPGKAVLRTRPLCVHPKVARWTGRGSTDEARNFVCH